MGGEDFWFLSFFGELCFFILIFFFFGGQAGIQLTVLLDCKFH